MTYDQTSFDAYHWLPEENPANIIEISSDDEDNTHTTGLPHADPVDETPKVTEPSPKAKAASAAFRKAIRQSMPVHLAAPQIRNQLRATAIWLLEMAVRSGATLADLFIDDNGLPMWPGRTWDPEAQSLHDLLQTRLGECSDGWALGSLLQPALVQLGNERLAEAVALGVRLEDMTIGEDVLPTWYGRAGDEASDTTMEVGSSVHSDDVPPPWSDCAAPVAPAESEEAAADETKLASVWSSDTESDGSEAPPVSEYDDEVSLFNFVNENPVLDELSEAAPLFNIVHDVEVYGESALTSGSLVDFSVYLASDDQDLEELPEAELMVDEEAFAHHYHLADAIDLELAGGEIYGVILTDEVEDCHAEVADVPQVPECATDSSTTEEGSTNAPVTPASETNAQVQADWVFI